MNQNAPAVRRSVAPMCRTTPSPPISTAPGRWVCPVQQISISGRSEERRVGKECRSLCDWSSDVCSSDLCETQRGTDVSHHAVAADLNRARPVGVPGAADLDLRVEAAQLEGHLVKPLAAAYPADRVSEHRM